MADNYYGCEGKHSEFTCLSAYFVGPKRFKNIQAWCQPCRDKYVKPTEEESE